MRIKEIIFLSPILFLLVGCNSYRYKSDAKVACENWAARGGTLYFKRDHIYNPLQGDYYENVTIDRRYCTSGDAGEFLNEIYGKENRARADYPSYWESRTVKRFRYDP